MPYASSRNMLFKLGSMDGERVVPVQYGNRFSMERTTGPDRLRIGLSDGQISWLWKLAFSLPAPYYVLYVLHTSRCGSDLGRYQSPEVDFPALNSFLAAFCEFLTNDGRHDLWVHSPEAEATLVWDRHDLIYGYGPLQQLRALLSESLHEGEVGGPPCPHVHIYHDQYDEAERRILRYYNWVHSPLLHGDEQWSSPGG